MRVQTNSTAEQLKEPCVALQSSETCNPVVEPTCHEVHWFTIDVQSGSVFSVCPGQAQRVPL